MNKKSLGKFPQESSKNLKASEVAPPDSQINENNFSLVQELAQTKKEVQELKESNQRLLTIEEKREREKEAEVKRKKSLEESLWWKKILAYASIVTAVGTLLNFVLNIFNQIRPS